MFRSSRRRKSRLNGRMFPVREWRWDSKKQRRSLTDGEYTARLHAWLEQLGVRTDWVCVDPSAASFSTQLFRDGINAAPADNAVLHGIRLNASLLAEGLLFVHESCASWIKKIGGYVWGKRARATARGQAGKG